MSLTRNFRIPYVCCIGNRTISSTTEMHHLTIEKMQRLKSGYFIEARRGLERGILKRL